MIKLMYILLAIVVLLVLITVHEFGHYCAGKIFGFKINEFSIGFGPAIFKKTRKDGEVFSVRALPLGGYCAFEGEDEDGKDKPGSFNSMAAWKRLIVLLAGVTFNFLFAILTATIYLAVSGYTTVKIDSIISQQGVETKGFMVGDVIVAVENKNVEVYRSFSDMIAKYGQDEEFEVTVIRNGQKQKITTKKQSFPAFYYVIPETFFENSILKDNVYIKVGDSYEKLTDLTEFKIGIAMQDTSSEEKTFDADGKPVKQLGDGQALESYLSNYYYKYNDNGTEVFKSWSEPEAMYVLLNGDESMNVYASVVYSKAGIGIGIIQNYEDMQYSFFQAAGSALPFCLYLCKLIFTSLVGLFSGSISVSEAGGTITAVSQIAEISRLGIEYFLLLLPLLSVNLAMFNVLPVPSLDGARAVFVLIEIIFRKPVPRKIEGWIHTVGLFVLLALVLFLDVNHFLTASYILQL